VDKRELEAKIFDLIGYMTSSARNLMDETPLYGPFRLVDAASRLIAILEEAGVESPRLASLRHEIDQGKYSVTATPAELKTFLDALVDRFVDHLDPDESPEF